MKSPSRNLVRMSLLGLSAVLCAGSLALAADHVPMSGPINPVDNSKPGVPGVRTCFWELGPFGGNPYLNIAWPDDHVFYWGAKFTVPEGAKLHLEGQFPHARYSSFTTYDERGQPIESVADFTLEPAPGHGNPSLQGADRTATRRSWQLDVEIGERDMTRKEGTYEEGRTMKVIHTKKNYGYQQVLFYRIYLGDKGTSITANTPLPAPVLTMADGKVLRGQEACTAMKAGQQMRINSDAVGMPASRYRELLTRNDRPDTSPATNPPTWYAQFERAQYESIFTGEKGDYSRKSEGFYPTLDNNYMRTFLNRKFGTVYVMRGKLPKTPKTYNGEPVMDFKDADMRYWSICSQKGSSVTMVTKCLSDAELVTDKDGFYVLAVSRAADRPRSAFAECGINWLPIPDDGDGMFDPDQGNLLMRNQLTNPSFKNGIQNVSKPGEEAKVLGEYMPKGGYIMTATFEGLYPCKSETEKAKMARDTAETDAAQKAARAK